MKHRSKVVVLPLLSDGSLLRDPKAKYSLKQRRYVTTKEFDPSSVEGRHLFAQRARDAARKETNETH